MSTPEIARTQSLSPRRSDPDEGDGQGDSKRRKTLAHRKNDALPNRRKTACHSCRVRKVKCDAQRPACTFCLSSGAECIYMEQNTNRVQLDPANKLLLDRIEALQTSQAQILRLVGELQATISGNVSKHLQDLPEPERSSKDFVKAHSVIERSRDYLQIPATKTTADTVLTWPVWGGEYPRDYMIRTLFRPAPGRPFSDHSVQLPYDRMDSTDDVGDEFSDTGGLKILPPEKISVLLISFLNNVHTKNPILDVESLIDHGRNFAEGGLGWDGMSCLVLIACALGSVACPFDERLLKREYRRMEGSTEEGPYNAKFSSALVYAKDLRQGETCFALACRRLGLLKHSILGSQCYFFAGVYLMYTMRPLSAWNHFYQASTFYQLYVKTLGGSLGEELAFPDPYHLSKLGRQEKHAEKNLYWSCFKSECEFRVELPMPQTELSNFERADLFPSPPSPVPVDSPKENRSHQRSYGGSTQGGILLGNGSSLVQGKTDLSKEESWYYYLTEVALRRIGNRIINTFYRQDFASWVNIQPLISIALEFDAQVSSWSANLPPAMQQYETLSTIKAPISDPLGSDNRSAVSKELSWATENRLLEMRSWLYQPFLYYVIHCGYPASPQSYSSNAPLGGQGDAFAPSIMAHAMNGASHRLTLEEITAVQGLIASGVECNLKILELRTVHHRHHGLWYDLRASITASLLLLAIVRSGNTRLIPGGIEALLGNQVDLNIRDQGGIQSPASLNDSLKIGGRLGLVLEALQFWSDESSDMKCAIKALRHIIRKTLKPQ